jgi:hypothetical protein
MEQAGVLPSTWHEAVITQTEAKKNKMRKKEKQDEYTTEKFLKEPITLSMSGRAPYTRELMEKAFAIVFSNDPVNNDPTAKGGPLEETGHMDREHIIPKSLRPSDSLESLVITYKAVNKWKGQRTAMQFMKECAGQPIPGMPGKELLPLKKYLSLLNPD